MKGKIKWFDFAKGFGFIDQPGESRDIFVHFSQIREEGFKSLEPGQEVEFEIFETERGLQAKNVVKI